MSAQDDRILIAADKAAQEAAWDVAPDSEGNQRWHEAELASAHYASLSPERKAELNEGWTDA